MRFQHCLRRPINSFCLRVTTLVITGHKGANLIHCYFHQTIKKFRKTSGLCKLSISSCIRLFNKRDEKPLQQDLLQAEVKGQKETALRFQHSRFTPVTGLAFVFLLWAIGAVDNILVRTIFSWHFNLPIIYKITLCHVFPVAEKAKLYWAGESLLLHVFVGS